MNRFIPGLFLLFFMVFFPIPDKLRADELELSNGDIITGKIITMDEEKVVIETEYGKLTIKRKFVKRGVFGDKEAEVSTAEGTEKEPVVIDYSEAIPEQGLICELLFDNTLTDTGGAVYTVKNVNDVPFCKGIDGIENHAVSSDGSGKYLVLSGYKELDTINALTISFWIYGENWMKTQYILSKWASTEGEKAEGKFAIHIKQGFVTCYFVDITGTYYSVFTENPMKLHVWNHVAVTLDKGNSRIYVNNQVTGKKTFGFTGLKQDSSPLYILTAKAAKGDTYAYYNMIGMLDNVRIFNRSLAEEEITALFYEKKPDY